MMRALGHLLLLCIPLVLGVTLTVNVHYPSEGGPLGLRGDSCGLSWSQDVPLHLVGSGLFQANLTVGEREVGRRLEMKATGTTRTGELAWAVGANEFVAALPLVDKTVAFAPFFTPRQGRYTYVRNIHSKELGNTRDLVVYTPPSYEENPFKVYPLLVMHDGQNLFNTSTSFGGIAWLCQDTVNTLVVQGAMEEIIIVGVDNTPERMYEYTYSKDPDYSQGGGADHYLDFLESTVLPRVQFDFRVDSTRLAGILGSSLGGLTSCYAALVRSTTYDRAGCMSSSFWWNNQDFNTTELVAHARTSVAVYLDSGDSGSGRDDLVETQTVRNHMQRKGWSLDTDLFYYLDKGGEHNEYYWGRRFHVPMTELYPPRPLQPL